MKKFLQKKLKNEKGLTLVELLAVIVILGIIAAIAVPAIGGIIDNSRIKAAHADAMNIMSAANLYFADNPDVTGSQVTLKELQDEKYIDNAGTFEINDSTIVKKITTGNTISGVAKWNKTSGKTVTYKAATLADINTAGTKGVASKVEIAGR
ncbi:hypothetical protein HMPREF9372_2831 [Sporosarcina newyorkensis 2681]|uniref:Tfp assembly type protein n=1 Tax=Sporosarcina newyorkensis 2681 TaxID=1027292 RepID=F9DVK0_9BACL|nr:prepilin-type N-terminal cleavage/methylation domain-containing protein [Sporosarcina newyorkensis]EGQ22551.1 hypothetical protein HMPREF9372_2831 [Sporosarcina newyorkensis 2681]